MSRESGRPRGDAQLWRKIVFLAAVLSAVAAPTGAQRGAGAARDEGRAARRLRELIAAVQSGSSARIRAFVRATHAPVP